MNRQNRRTAARWGIRVVTVAAGEWFLYSFFKAEAAIQSGILALIGVAAGIVTLIVLGRKGPHGFPFRRPHSHFPIH